MKPSKKIAARLKARQDDFDNKVDDKYKARKAFHRPGSRKKK